MGNGPGEGKNIPDFKGKCTFDHKSGQIKAEPGAFGKSVTDDQGKPVTMAKFLVGDEIEIRNTAANDANMRTVVEIDGAAFSYLVLNLPVKDEDAGNAIINRLQFADAA